MRLRRLIVLLPTLLSGCASLKEAMYNPSLEVTAAQPAPVNLGAAKKLTIVQIGQARSVLREKLVSELLKQGRATGYFQIADRSEEGITLKRAGRTATSTAPMAPGEVFLAADFIDSGADSVTKQVAQKDAQGNAVQRDVTVYQGRATIGFTVANAKGLALAADKQIEGAAEAEKRDDALDGALKAAVAQFYRQATPGRSGRTVTFDKSDLAQRPILDFATAGNIGRATEEMRKYLKATPTNPVAIHNLALLLEASGKFEEALDLHTQAASASGKPEHAAAKSACARALADQQALAE